MPYSGLISSTILLVDIMIPITLLSVWMVLLKARKAGPGAIAIGSPIAIALLWGSLWTWQPKLAAMRLLPPPAGQGFAILAVIVGSLGLLLLPQVRQYFKTADPLALVSIGPWRAFYGAILLIIGLAGGLPAIFFWSAAIGDIVVGLWAISIMQRRAGVSTREITAWNIAGLVDLTHVLALGAINLAAFYTANPTIPPLNLLPLAGVPVLLVLHAMTLWGMAARRQETTQEFTPKPLNQGHTP